MILLENNTRAGAPTLAYPFGFIVDENGSNNGTFIDSNFLNDLWQLKEKTFDESGITANGLPDNETNGFQLFQAFAKVFGIQKEVTGTWDMEANATFTVNHGLSDHLKIRGVDVMVKSDTGAVFAPLLSGGTVSVIDSTVINLTRESGAGFDNTNFNAATIYVTIRYNL
jgi:hypothetical protein